MPAKDAERILPTELTPIANDVIEQSVWVFPSAENPEYGSLPKIILHSDSLLVEDDGMRREWFCIRKDTMFYAGWECINEIAAPRKPIAAFSLPNITGNGESVIYLAFGRSAHSYSLEEHGRLETKTGRRGTLIIEPNDTLRGVTVTQETIYADVRPGWITDEEDVPSVTRMCYRWYADGDTLPLAIQTSEVFRDASGAIISETKRAFAVDVSEYLAEHRAYVESVDAEAIRDALSSSTTAFNGHDIQINILLPEGIAGEITVDIVDAQGHLYSHTVLPCNGATTVIVSGSELRRGEYIAAISVSMLPGEQEKRIVVVR